MMLVNEHLSGCDATTPTFEQKTWKNHLAKTRGKRKEGKGNEARQKDTEEKAKERKKVKQHSFLPPLSALFFLVFFFCLFVFLRCLCSLLFLIFIYLFIFQMRRHIYILYTTEKIGKGGKGEPAKMQGEKTKMSKERKRRKKSRREIRRKGNKNNEQEKSLLFASPPKSFKMLLFLLQRYAARTARTEKDICMQSTTHSSSL